MSTAMEVPTITGEQAAEHAAKLTAKITESESFLAEAPALIDAAVREEIRTGKTGDVTRLEKKRNLVESELPRLRSRRDAYIEIENECAAEAAEIRRAEIRAEADGILTAQREELTAFGEWFAAGYPIWERYAAAVLELDAVWRGNPQVFGDAPPHVLGNGKFPVRFASLLELAAGSMHRDWAFGGDRNPLNEFVPASLPRDPQLEVGGTLDRF